MSTPSPTESCRRKVLIYPAQDDKPHVQLMDFNEAGSDHPNGFYTTAIDLRETYGKYVRQTLVQRFSMYRTEETVADDHNGNYIIYFNLNLALPLNLSLARLLNIDPKLPGPRPTWRGDVIVVRHQPWPKALKGRIPAREWLNIAPTMQQRVDQCFKDWYDSKKWATRIADENRWAEEMKRLESPDPSDHEAIDMRRRLEHTKKLQNHLGLDKLKHLDKPDAKETGSKQKAADQRRMDKMWDKLEKHQEKQALRQALNKCQSCDIIKADLKICKKCKQARYCGRECQVSDWKRHKRECVEVMPEKE